ncbi:MAG: TOBE domain-containing protein [Bacteroidales bacterium]|nr:TOBE domain-containing protein [Bacteroidales bacterium]
MKISARNVLKGTVLSYEIGAVNVEVVIEIAPGMEITSVITKESFNNLGLEEGKEAYAIIKGSNVMIGTD